MRKIFFAVLMCMCVLLSGCQDSDPISDSNIAPPDITPSGAFSDDPDLYLEVFNFRSRLLILDRGGNTHKTHFSMPTDGKLGLTVNAEIVPDKSMIEIPAAIRVYILGDGKPLKFQVPGLSESDFVHEIVPSDLSGFSFDIDLDLTSSDEINTIAVIWDMYPDYIPKKGTGQFGGCTVHLMQNDSCTYYNFAVSGDDPGYFNVGSEDEQLDIGTIALNSSDTITEEHFYNDILLTPENKDLFIKFNSGKDSNVPYYMILFRDGELLDAFDGEYSYLVDCLSGERTIQIKIPESLIPDSGLHTFQAVAIPMYAHAQSDQNSRYSTISTSKIRVQVQA